MDVQPANLAQTEQDELNAPEAPYGASVVVYRRTGSRTEFLLLRRGHFAPEYTGDWAWGPPAGGREPGETIAHCAARELLEETGLRLPLRATEAGSDEWVVFLAEAPADAIVALSDEHDRYAWLSLERAAAVSAPEVVRAGFLAAAACIGT